MSKDGSSSSHPMEIKIDTKVEYVIKDCCIGSSDFVRPNYPLVKLRNPTQFRHEHQQAVFLDIHQKDTASLYSIEKIHSIIHPNVLGCYYFKEVDEDFCKKFMDFVETKKDEKYLMVLTEEISGSLEGLIMHKFQNFLVRSFYVPSVMFIELTRSIIDVLRFIHGKKTYHGNLLAKSTPFVYEEGKIVVKLANFIEKKCSVEEAQLQDWNDLANLLRCVLNDCSEGKFVNHLAEVIQFFEQINRDQIANMHNLLPDFDFFWTPQDRRMYAKKLVSWCNNHSVRLRQKHAHLVKMPWNNFKDVYGNDLLRAINNFNDKDGKKGIEYDTMDVVYFLRFISAIYAHCNTIQVDKRGLQEIDNFICFNFPDLFSKLRGIEQEFN